VEQIKEERKKQEREREKKICETPSNRPIYFYQFYLFKYASEKRKRKKQRHKSVNTIY
jgi:hypothetical protein